MAVFAGPVGAVRVGDLAQMAHRLAQPRRIQLSATERSMLRSRRIGKRLSVALP